MKNFIKNGKEKNQEFRMVINLITQEQTLFHSLEKYRKHNLIFHFFRI